MNDMTKFTLKMVGFFIILTLMFIFSTAYLVKTVSDIGLKNIITDVWEGDKNETNN